MNSDATIEYARSIWGWTMQNEETLATRLQGLEDREAIRALKAYYARCADEKYTDDHHRLPQEAINAITRRQVEATFTEDAVWDGGPQFGRREGREQIYDHLRSGGWNFSLHYFVSPVIELDGDAATRCCHRQDHVLAYGYQRNLPALGPGPHWLLNVTRVAHTRF
jgi:hypothetical protein